MTELDRLLASSSFEINNCDNRRKLDVIKSTILGKNGKLTEIIKTMAKFSGEEKREFGIAINNVKSTIMDLLNTKANELELKELELTLAAEAIDVAMPPKKASFGKIHPITQVIDEVSNILSNYGMLFASGPEIESEYYNFTALNIPEHHPARQMCDTFYINQLADEQGRKLLRTHTSPVQIHAMLAHKAPARFFSIGKTYRSDYDATHTPMFHQIEGIVIEPDISFANLKWILMDFLKRFFGVKTLSLRFRPSFFPFTQPSAEVDLNYHVKDGRMIFGSGDKWLEVAGCGMVHPNVLKNGKIDPTKYQGFAFGFGVERLTSLKYGVPDLRGYFESTDRWRNSFGFHYAHQ